MIRVFISSVSKGLAPIRQQIIAHLQTAGYHVGVMESFGAQAIPPLDVCLRELRKSDVVVLIVGPRYGSQLPQGISYTHAEFREARAIGLPILAFRVPDAADLQQKEQSLLAEFLTEVGSVTTYKALDSRANLELLSGEIQAALMSARDRGELGSRFSLFQPYYQYFSKQLGSDAPLFNHESPFVGREAELERIKGFLDGTDAVLILKAPGGCGKSRLLLELAKYVASSNDSPKFLFVDVAGQWTTDDINRLPVTPLIIAVDDAHRRADLDGLIFACLKHNPRTRFLVSCRPSAVDLVKRHIATLATTSGIPEIQLSPLRREEAEELARYHLGAEYSELASRLVRIADQNPLVIAVGGKCIAERRVAPEVLERTPEVFRSLVLDRLLDDPGLNRPDVAEQHKVLEVIAAIGPVVPEGEEFLGTLSSAVNLTQRAVGSALSGLERAGFLIRRGRLVRVSPDVLADHLLYRAAVDDLGRPTGFVEQMVRTFSPGLLENILANASELDWRASSTAKHESVLTKTWRDIFDSLPQATHSQRSTLLGQLTRAAVFAPEKVLQIAEWLADHRDAPPDENLRAWGLDDSFERQADQITDTFAFVATHPEFTDRCLGQLWELASSDERPTSPNPSHPRRRFDDLLKYEWRADWQGPDSVHVRVIDFVVAKVREAPRGDDRSWAIELLGTALNRLGEANEWNKTSFTASQFSLAPFLPTLRERREKIIGCFRDLTLGLKAVEAVAALRQLSKLFYAPRGPFGKALNADEIAAWQPEAQSAVGITAEAATSASSDVVRYVARRTLREAPRQHWPEIASALDEALQQTAPIPAEGIYDLFVGIPWEEQLDEFDAEEKRVGELCDSAASISWRQLKTASLIVANLLEADAAIEAVRGRGESHAGKLVCSLISANPGQAEAVIRAFVESGEGGWKFLRPAIATMFDFQPDDAVRIVDRLTHDEPDTLRSYAAETLQWMAKHSETSQEVLTITNRLSQDPSLEVKCVVPQILRRFRDTARDRALRILVSIDLAGDARLATAVFHALHPKFGLDPHDLKDEDIDNLLEGIAALETIDDRAYDVLAFIEFASLRRPESTVQMLIQRVLAADRQQSASRKNRWTPIPYSGHGLSLGGLSRTERYPALLRRIRDVQLDASYTTQFWLATLFQAAIVDLSVGLEVLREWLQTGEFQKIAAVANLLRGFDHSIVFSAHEFIADLLDAAEKVGQQCLRETKSDLFAIAIGGVHTSTPGQPAPRYISDKASAQDLAKKYDSRPAVRTFYESLVENAESSIERDMLQWEEQGDE